MFQKIIAWFKSILHIYPKATPVVSAPVDPTPVPPQSSQGSIPSDHPQLLIGEITNTINDERQTILSAIVNLRDIVYSKVFADLVLGFQFTNTNGDTNQQILDNFISKSLTINVDVFSGTYVQDHWDHTDGYEQKGDAFVHANRYFMKSIQDFMQLILHEVGHLVGYSHDSPTEYTSIPYCMDDIALIAAVKLGIIHMTLDELHAQLDNPWDGLTI